MKRVLIWGMTSNWGGIESVLYNYVMNSNQTKIVFDFISTFASIPREKELQRHGCKVTHIIDRRTNYLQYRSELDQYMKKHAHEYDAVWLNDCMFANIDILKLAKKYGVKKRIIHAHNSNSLGGGLSRMIRHKINVKLLPLYATDYWACSQLAGEWSYPNKILSSKKYRVIPNAIKCEKYRFSQEIRKDYREQLDITDKFIVGHIGRFDYQKNHIYLLKIFKELLQMNKDCILLSIGVGTDWEFVQEETKKMGIGDNVMFLGQRNDIAQLLQAMDVFVLPSQFEGLPVVLVEAMAAGLPCFISDRVTKESGIIQDLAFFESIDKSPVIWAENIRKLSLDFKRKDTYKDMVEAGYEIFNQASEIHLLF